MKKAMKFLMLPLTCLVLGLGLAFTNAFTKPVIEEINIKMATDARKEVLPTASEFEEMQGSYPAGITSVYKGTNGEGIAVELTVKGYGGDMNMMVGVDADGKVSHTKIVSASETAGVGAKTYEKDFLELFGGKTGKLISVKGAPGKEEEVAAISGATVSSKAVTAGVNLALETFEQAKEELK